MPRFGFSSLVALGALLLCLLPAFGTQAQAPMPAPPQTKADACIAWLRARLGWSEVGANNRAPFIDEWARQAGVVVGTCTVDEEVLLRDTDALTQLNTTGERVNDRHNNSKRPKRIYTCEAGDASAARSIE